LKVVSTVPSPDGGYIATIYVVSGGGATGWCDQRVSVNTKSQPFDPQKISPGTDYYFSASCGSQVHVSWLYTNVIQIKYSIGEGVDVYQRWAVFGLPVSIKYVLE
jgi:hypothetical protein